MASGRGGGGFTPPNPFGGFTPSKLPLPAPSAPPRPAAPPRTARVRTGQTTQVRTQFGPVGSPQDIYTTVNTATRPDDRGGARGGGTAAPASGTAATRPPLDVTGMQKFLNAQGYSIPVDGLNGPLTQAAAADFRGSRNPHAFNVGHGLIVGSKNTAPPAPSPSPTASRRPTAAAPTRTSTRGRASTATVTPTPAAPSDSTTARAVIQSILAPVIAQITNAEKARASQGQSLINGYTSNAVDQLKGLDFGAPYQAAEGDQNAVNTALLARLGNQGSALQNQLQGELGTSVGAPATDAVVGKVGADTTGAGNAGLAKGDATLSSLISQGAAAKTYGSKLPGIETLAGLQDAEKLQGAVNTDQANQLSSIESKVPSMVQLELGALASARTARQKNEIAALIASGKTDAAVKIAQMNNNTRVSIANANNATRQQIAAQTAAFKQAGLQTKGQPTDSQLSKLIDAWKTGKLSSVTTIARDASGNPIPNSSGAPETTTQTVPTGQLNYTQAYQRLRSFGISDQKARTLLNTAYQRGEQGRAWVSNEEQAALKTAGLPAKATVINGHGVFNRKQYQALKAAKKLPPGTLTAEGAYVIAPGY